MWEGSNCTKTPNTAHTTTPCPAPAHPPGKHLGQKKAVPVRAHAGCGQGFGAGGGSPCCWAASRNTNAHESHNHSTCTCNFGLTHSTNTTPSFTQCTHTAHSPETPQPSSCPQNHLRAPTGHASGPRGGAGAGMGLWRALASLPSTHLCAPTGRAPGRRCGGVLVPGLTGCLAGKAHRGAGRLLGGRSRRRCWHC
jgi:hypothetical protein